MILILKNEKTTSFFVFVGLLILWLAESARERERESRDDGTKRAMRTAVGARLTIKPKRRDLPLSLPFAACVAARQASQHQTLVLDGGGKKNFCLFFFEGRVSLERAVARLQ